MISGRQGIANLPGICSALGMHHVVISPGSRNAPLIAAFADYKEITIHSCTDERSAAFFGLGIAQQLQKPVGIICTSGTAVLNFAPAIAEAYYQHIPLIVFTADRPPEWIDQGDGQTMRQKNIYGNYIKKSMELPVETLSEADLRFIQREVSGLINYACTAPYGPVHVNVPLREPLYNEIPARDKFSVSIPKIGGTPVLTETAMNEFKLKFQVAGRIFIICGFMPKKTVSFGAKPIIFAI